MHVDVGHLFHEEYGSVPQGELRPDVELMNRWMLRGFSRFKLDAANLSYQDLYYCTYSLNNSRLPELIKEAPLAAELISANAAPAAGKPITAPKPYIIREVSGTRLKSPLRVGFIGLTEAYPGVVNPNSGFTIEDPLKRIRQVLPEVRSKADLIVVLAYVNQETARKLAQENPDIDVILAANQMAQPVEAMREGKTVIAYAWQQTKSLGELRLYMDSSGKVVDYMNRYLALDKSIPDQPEAAKIVAESKATVAELKAKVDAAINASGAIGSGKPVNQYVMGSSH